MLTTYEQFTDGQHSIAVHNTRRHNVWREIDSIRLLHVVWSSYHIEDDLQSGAVQP